MEGFKTTGKECHSNGNENIPFLLLNVFQIVYFLFQILFFHLLRDLRQFQMTSNLI